jgi:hypothetical protein
MDRPSKGAIELELQAGKEVPNAFPNVDFYLTAPQVHLLFTNNFLCDNFLRSSPYREHR